MSARPADRPTFDNSDLRTLAFIAFISIGLGLTASTFINSVFGPKEWTPVVRMDPATGCQYLEGSWGQLTPRVNAEGKPICIR